MATRLGLRVMTFNAMAGPWKRRRLAAFARAVTGRSLDMLLLQEVMFVPHVKGLTRGIGSLPYCAFEGVGPLVRGGLVTLSRWPIQDYRFVSFGHRKGWPHASFTQRLVPRGALIVQVEISDGEAMVVVNTHLQHNPMADWSRLGRYALRERFELHRLGRMIAGLSPNLPLIVAGDFNVPAGSLLLDEFLTATGLHDPLEQPREPTYRRSASVPDPKAIDHVLVRGCDGSNGRGVAEGTRLGVREEQVPGANGMSVAMSDHYAVEATVQIQRTTAQ